MMFTPALKRILLYVLVGSVAIGAVLAILFVLLNSWGWFELRVIFTTVIFAIASLCFMACELARTPKGLNVLPYAGLSLTALASLMILLGMWSSVFDEHFWQLSLCLCGFAIATVHACLISVAPLAGKFKWVYYIALQLSYGLAILFSLLILEAFPPEAGIIRLIIALAIVETALTLIIPILSRISRTEQPAELLETTLELRNEAAIDREIALLRQRIAELERLRNRQPEPPKP